MSLIVTIDLGDGRTDDIKVSPNSDLRTLASLFCTKHSLAPSLETVLIQELQRNTLPMKASEIQNDSTLSTNFTGGDKSPENKTVSRAPAKNYGVKLYEKGLRYMEIIANKVEKFKKMREENEDRNLTFTPKTNKSRYASSVKILLQAGVKTEEKLEKMRGEKLNSEITSCTFSPRINRRSQNLAIKRKLMTPDKDYSTSFGSSCNSSFNIIKLQRSGVYEDLYQEGKSWSEKKQKLAENLFKEKHTFTPDISITKEVDEKLLMNRGTYKRISDSKKEIMHYLRLKALNTDMKTGQELFKPIIHNYPIGKRRYFSFCNHRRLGHTRFHRLTSENSDKILKRIRFLRYSTIFNSLCPENGIIHCKTICKASLTTNLRKVLDPILKTVENHNLSLDFSHFSLEMDELMKRLTPEERNFIIKGEKPAEIRSKSVQIIPLKFSIYERNVAKLRETRMKLETLRKKRKQEELKGCTFAPSLRKYSPEKKQGDLWAFEWEDRLNCSSIN